MVIFLLRLPFYQASEHDILRTNKPILMRIYTLVHEAAASNDQLCESEGKDQGHMRPKIDLEACLALASFSSHFARTAFIVFLYSLPRAQVVPYVLSGSTRAENASFRAAMCLLEV